MLPNLCDFVTKSPGDKGARSVGGRCGPAPVSGWESSPHDPEGQMVKGGPGTSRLSPSPPFSWSQEGTRGKGAVRPALGWLGDIGPEGLSLHSEVGGW